MNQKKKSTKFPSNSHNLSAGIKIKYYHELYLVKKLLLD